MLITKKLLIISLIFLSSQIINADYTSQLALAKNQAFIDRVQVGMLAAAIAVSNETTTVQNHPNRIKLAKDIIGDMEISTIFLGIDHNNFGLRGKPLLFETMIFGGDKDEKQWRWHTWKEAKKGHKRIISELKEKSNEKM